MVVTAVRSAYLNRTPVKKKVNFGTISQKKVADPALKIKLNSNSPVNKKLVKNISVSPVRTGKAL